MSKIHVWVKTLPPALQSLYYSVEAAVIAAVVLFLTAVLSYAEAKGTFAGFDWRGQLLTLQLSVSIGALKALLDYLKGYATPSTGQKDGTPPNA
jgi:hypothetical protein